MRSRGRRPGCRASPPRARGSLAREPWRQSMRIETNKPARRRRSFVATAILLAALATIAGGGAAHADKTLLNVSYDPTRELYQAYNAAFAKHWKETTGEAVTINTSNGGSGKQARAVID